MLSIAWVGEGGRPADVSTGEDDISLQTHDVLQSCTMIDTIKILSWLL